MKLIKGLFCLSFLFLLSCSVSSDPARKKQPYSAPKKTDKKLNDVSFNPAVDILFIIDDSGSMSSYQKKLLANADLFIERFFKTKFIDYHVGVTTSTLTQSSWGGSLAPGGKLMNIGDYTYVDRNVIDGEGILAQMMNVGKSGGATEHFFSIHVESFSDDLMQTVNANFYREDAKLAIIVITDTEDQSSYSVQDAYDFLLDLKDGDEKKLHYVAALVETNKYPCVNEGTPPRKLLAMVDMHKDRGYKFDLCQPDYGVDLAKVASDLVRSVSTIRLDELPDVRTIKVTYGDFVIPNDPEVGWVYNAQSNSIYLSPKIDIRDPEPQELKITFDAIYK